MVIFHYNHKRLGAHSNGNLKNSLPLGHSGSFKVIQGHSRSFLWKMSKTRKSSDSKVWNSLIKCLWRHSNDLEWPQNDPRWPPEVIIKSRFFLFILLISYVKWLENWFLYYIIITSRIVIGKTTHMSHHM